MAHYYEEIERAYFHLDQEPHPNCFLKTLASWTVVHFHTIQVLHDPSLRWSPVYVCFSGCKWFRRYLWQDLAALFGHDRNLIPSQAAPSLLGQSLCRGR